MSVKDVLLRQRAVTQDRLDDAIRIAGLHQDMVDQAKKQMQDCAKLIDEINKLMEGADDRFETRGKTKS